MINASRVASLLVYALCAVWILVAAGGTLLVPLGLAFGPGPTSAQAALLHVAMWLIPGVGFGSFFLTSGALLPRFRRAGAVLVLSLLVFAANAAACWMAFPAYPTCGPHEVVAIALLVPSIAALLALAWLPIRGCPMPKHQGLQSLAIGLTAGVMLLSDYHLFRQTMRNAVPITTRELCYESYYDMQDIDQFALRARMTAEQAAAITRSLKLTPVSGPMTLATVGHHAIDWWAPAPHASHLGDWDKSTRVGAEAWEGCRWQAAYVGEYLFLSMDCGFL